MTGSIELINKKMQSMVDLSKKIKEEIETGLFDLDVDNYPVDSKFVHMEDGKTFFNSFAFSAEQYILQFNASVKYKVLTYDGYYDRGGVRIHMKRGGKGVCIDTEDHTILVSEGNIEIQIEYGKDELGFDNYFFYDNSKDLDKEELKEAVQAWRANKKITEDWEASKERN